MPDTNVTIDAEFELIPVYTITLGTINGGTINVSASAAAGSSVSLTGVPTAPNNALGTVTVTPTVTVSGAGNTRTFTMPENNVTINADFVVLPSLPEDFESGTAGAALTTVSKFLFTAPSAGGSSGTAIFDGDDKHGGNLSAKFDFTLGTGTRNGRFVLNNYSPMNLSGTQVITFWAKSTVAGTYRLVTRNSDATDRAATFVFQASELNEWKKFSVTANGNANQRNNVNYISFEVRTNEFGNSISGTLWVDDVAIE